MLKCFGKLASMKATAKTRSIGGIVMPVPFYRTIKQSKEKGFVRTASMVLVLSLRFILEHLKYFPENTIVEVNNSKMFLLPRKGAIHRELFSYKKREPICTNYLMHSGILKEGDVVLDIGANIGYYVLVEAQLVGKSGKVYAVEPVCSNFELLQKNVQLNSFKNVSTFQFAFGEKDTKSEIYVSDKSNLCAMNRNAVGGKIISAQEVCVETVDTFFKDKAPPNLIRMDVEGYEYEIIKGMAKTLKGNIKILAELHPLRCYIDPEKMDELFQVLEQNNFTVRFVVFEDKVVENRIVRFLLKKAGDKLPIVASNISMQELKKLIEDNPGVASPNVVFEKQISPD
jgi:FkbM family methyltransferase